ncbi:MAG: flap structure-specific endonuclease, partial [Methanosarcinales archaeon]|nr:flap structure-specific endonuclease [Methanosarcinales archaeon]
ITREQLIDIGILVGTDYDPGIHGIGAKKALQSIHRHGSIEDVLTELGKSIENLYEIKDFFLNPLVTSDYSLKWKTPDESKIKELLCDEHSFSEARVTKAAERLTVTADSMKQSTLDMWG